MANKFALIEQNKPMDIVFTIDINEWNGEKSLQIKLLDLQLSKD